MDGSVKKIPLSSGKFVLVDAEDYDWLSLWDWHEDSDGYAFRWEDWFGRPRKVYMHNEIERKHFYEEENNGDIRHQ